MKNMSMTIEVSVSHQFDENDAQRRAIEHVLTWNSALNSTQGLTLIELVRLLVTKFKPGCIHTPSESAVRLLEAMGKDEQLTLGVLPADGKTKL